MGQQYANLRLYYFVKDGYKKGSCLTCGAIVRKNKMTRHSEWHSKIDQYPKPGPDYMGLSYSIVSIDLTGRAVNQTGWVTNNTGPC